MAVTLENSQQIRLSLYHRFMKRLFDIIVSLILLILTSWIILIAIVIASLDTQKNGLFVQRRVGLNGKLFAILKIRTMKVVPSFMTTVTTGSDPRITKVGAVLRKTKIDELPQLLNVLIGQMSFVGPRPDVPEYTGNLSAEDSVVLSIRPGITGPATLKYRNEEEILASSEDPEEYNRTVIFPDKIKINKAYIQNYSLRKDVLYIYYTAFPNKFSHYLMSDINQSELGA
ncbi:sugar transferase [Paenibacillus sp. SI8]|uniref:sugar transferase n=1 Tax=unclassified Paenibacillus TaxID=185978 RepID=UPI0034669476